MLARPKKKELSAEERQQITSASAKQTGQMNSPKSYDPDYPLFEVPVNRKLLVYIPNHTVTHEDGSVGIRMDKFAAHAVRQGKSYSTVRCSSGVVNESLHLDGSCPLCNATQFCWDLYNKQYADIAAQKGLTPDSAEAHDLLADDRKKLLGDMVIKQPEIFLTFPIVVIEADDKMNAVLDADNRVKGVIQYYTVREQTYNDKWGKAFDALSDQGEDNDNNPAGRWAILNFTYTPKSGEPNKRDSARNLSITFVKRDNLKAIAEWYDKATEGWTPEKAQDVLVANSVRDMEEMEAAADELIKPTKERLAMYDATMGIGMTEGGATSSAEAALESFGATPAVPEAPAAVAPALPPTGITEG